MTPDRRDDSRNDEPAWHERTSTVVGASVGALAVIGLLWLLISYVAGGSNDPPSGSQYFLEPSVSGSSTELTTTSTETITSTSPPMTTDINPGETSTTSGTDTTTTTTTSTTPFDASNLPRTRTSTTYGDGDTSTRRRPRLNETRTLYPPP